MKCVTPERFLSYAKSDNAAQVVINDPVLPALLQSAPRYIFQKGTCQVPEEQIGSVWPLETAVRGRARKGVSGWIPLVSANDKSVKISIVPIQVQMLERNSRSASRDLK